MGSLIISILFDCALVLVGLFFFGFGVVLITKTKDRNFIFVCITGVALIAVALWAVFMSGNKYIVGICPKCENSYYLSSFYYCPNDGELLVIPREVE